MKRTKTIALLLALAMGLSLAACGSSGGPAPTPQPDYKILSVTTTTQVESDISYTTVLTLEYDVRGLVSAVAQSDGAEELRIPVSYSFNEQGDPIGVAADLEDMGIRFTIEDRYTDGVLTEATIAEATVTENGETLSMADLAGDAASLTASHAALALTMLRFVQNYTGYRDCTLRFGETGDLIRYENGRQVYTYAVYPGMEQETIVEYGDDGSVRTTSNSYAVSSEGEKTLQSGTGSLTDADNFLQEQVVSMGAQGELSFTLRYEEGIDTKTGAQLRSGYVDEIRFPASTGASDAELEQAKAMFQDVLIIQYTLDREGKISKSEFSPSFSQLVGGSGVQNYTTTWYNADGTVSRTENIFANGSYSSTTVTEYAYR